MDLDRIRIWKDRIALIGAALCCLLVLTALDGGAAYLRNPFNSLRLLAGESMRLTGPMAPGIVSIEGMEFESDSPHISMNLEEVISGFWMGAKMWRGRVNLSQEIPPGKYRVTVFGKEDRKKVGENTFQVIVYRDRAAYLADSKSVILRYSGISPWAVGGILFATLFLTCGCLYLISGKRDRLMAEKGEAEVFHVIRDATGSSIYFGLGQINGIEKGSEMLLMDPKGLHMEEIRVESVSETDAVAKVGPLSEVRTGYLVKRK